MSEYQRIKREMINYPAISQRLRGAIHSFDDADIVDALNDAECLLALLRMKMDEDLNLFPCDCKDFSTHLECVRESGE